MGLDYLASDVQAQAQALGTLALLPAVEALKQMRLVLGGDARPIVADGDKDLSTFHPGAN